ncbi:hypothetical protein PC9H_006780 [Pleurotus ostreatus]|uniref:F-box domain-containing protein n=1 Tax=Pleurotus ostreatus TaxID=5322 RepID=A0A8H6ZY86_PLEOS|nr:uncharacterized protein PC9H_006780 [Pleurotus ostreatus]KAF7431062.1 hypothetical protein PC9H_006780 [Pleurotus ostreatus]
MSDIGLVSKPLPLELISEIVAFLDDRDDIYGLFGKPPPPSLFPCSLVCRAWNIICRSHIFCRVIICDFDRHFSRLSFLHFTAPHLFKAIRFFHFGWNVDVDDSVTALPSWVSDCSKRFENLRVLSLWGGSTDMLKALDLNLTPLVATPRLRKLYIQTWCFEDDASDLLDILLSTNPKLEELVLDNVFGASDVVDEDDAPDAPSVVRFDALRCLELQNVDHSLVRFSAFIECPNLKSLVAEWPEDWDLPPWCSTNFSDLEILVDTDCSLPNFGKAIRPSAFTIDIIGLGSILEIATWIKDCINRLPFPDLVRQLTISADICRIDEQDFEAFYCEIADLFCFLQQIRDLGGLEGMSVSIKVPVESRLSSDNHRFRLPVFYSSNSKSISNVGQFRKLLKLESKHVARQHRTRQRQYQGLYLKDSEAYRADISMGISHQDTSSFSKQLPTELILQIIAGFDRRGNSNTYSGSVTGVPPCLTACSLVCHAWNDICRPYIFRIVEISAGTLIPRLSFLHFEAPHLCNYVLDFRLSLDTRANYEPFPAWLPDCFSRFRNLGTLYLADIGSVNSSLAELSPLDMGITTLLATAPNLRKLHLEGWDHDRDVVSVLPTSSQLEDLSLNVISTNMTTVVSSPPRFDALQILELDNIPYPLLRFKTFIECPNLRSLVAEWYDPVRWKVPPWVSTRFSELTLNVNVWSGCPDFGEAIQPSVLTINIFGSESCSNFITWIKNCVASLPFPNLLHRVTINIKVTGVNERKCEELYRELEKLSVFLHKLCDLGALQRIVLKIELFAGRVNTINDSYDILDPSSEVKAQDLAKLKDLFSALLERDSLDFDVILEWCSTSGDLVFYTRVQN